jgi:rubrerythrin
MSLDRCLPGGTRSAYSRLRILSGQPEKVATSAASPAVDQPVGLSLARQQGWARFLSSIATTESIEAMLIGPLKDAFRGESEVQEYLAGHAADEQRHFEIFRDYASGTFGFEKKKRSVSDRVVYDTLLPWVSAFARRRPICALAILRFYEAFSVEFYRVLRRLAERDGLSGLLGIIRSIEKDELRHLAGLEELIRRLKSRGARATLFDRGIIRSVLFVLMVDIDLRGRAFHNREVRRHAREVGIDPVEMHAQAVKAARNSMEFCR